MKRLKNFEWFKFNNEVTIENLLKYLVNKLIQRDSSNHSDLSNIIVDIRKYK